MTTPHKHADVIHAIAEGEEVEGFFGMEGTGWRPASTTWNPISYPDADWRIKPQKQVLRYRVAVKQNSEGKKYLIFVTNEANVHLFVETKDSFVKWADDWQEVEVE